MLLLFSLSSHPHRSEDWWLKLPKITFYILSRLLSCEKKNKISRKLIDLIKLWMRPWLKLLCYLFCFCFGRYPLIDDDESCLLLLAYTDWCGNWFCFNNKSFTLSLPAISFNHVHRHVVIHSTKNKRKEIFSVVLICRIINQKMKSSSLFFRMYERKWDKRKIFNDGGYATFMKRLFIYPSFFLYFIRSLWCLRHE
jgi:hypothetical protein